MHYVLLFIAGFMTLMLAGPAMAGGLLRAWMLTVASALPVAVLYLGFRGDGDAWFLWPAFLLLSITAYKAARVLLSLHAQTPASLNNVPADGSPHWAS